MPMLMTMLAATPRISNEKLKSIIVCLSVAFVLIVLLCLFRKRFLKIICACGTVVCLFLACKLFFGEDSIITVIMQWVTTAAACIATVAIVNRINWSNVRGRPHK